MVRLIIVLFYCLLVTPLFAANVLLMNTTGKPPLNTPDQSGFMDRVAAEALQRIGYRLETVQLPAERGLANANAGIDDGEMSRIAGLEKLYPNLIQVPEKIMSWEFTGFSNQDIRHNGKWSDLKPYTVAYINGWKILEKNVPAETAVTRVRNSELLFALLQKRRTDLIIYERWGGLQLLHDNEMQETVIMQPAFAESDMYIYLHKKHRDIVSQLAQALASMKKDGSYQKIYAETLAPLAKQIPTR